MQFYPYKQRLLLHQGSPLVGNNTLKKNKDWARLVILSLKLGLKVNQPNSRAIFNLVC